MSKELKNHLDEKLKDVPMNWKAKILVAYAVGDIDDNEFKSITGLEPLKEPNANT